MSKHYYRPIARLDGVRSPEALPLAGGWTWFDQVEVLSRDAAPQLIPASDVPEEIKTRLTDARPQIAGLSFARPLLMGIVNATPDSFSDGGQFYGAPQAIAHGEKLIREGADILDIGGESTRPGADYVTPEDECARVVPVIEGLAATGTPISIDTRKADVAAAALAAGAQIVNDVSALSFDPQMAKTCAGHPVCLMHAQGTPDVMQDNPQYMNVVLDVYDALEERIFAATSEGVSRGQIMVDPGIGFGKTLEHNLLLLRNLSLFHGLGCPILLGVSRKGFIGTLADEPQADQRVSGSVAVGLDALRQGVQILRVHDMKETKQAVRLLSALHGL